MINALHLENNKKYYKEKLCNEILSDIEVTIWQTDRAGKSSFTTREYPRYIEGKYGYWESVGNIATDLTLNDIEFIEGVLKQCNFKFEPIRYKDTATIKWNISWDNILYTCV